MAARTTQTMDLGALRRHHLSLVLEHLLRVGPTSRADVAKETGLAKASVSSLVGDLQDLGLVRELEARASGRRGRPATVIVVEAHTVGGLGLEINVDHTAALVVDLLGREVVSFRADGDNRARSSAEVFEELRTLAKQARASAKRNGARVTGATLALPGLVGAATGQVHVAPNLHWLDVSGDVRRQLRLPARLHVRCDNEANLAALAELRFGVGTRHRSFVYVSAGVGIGAGVVIDGRLVGGAHGFAGELGHVVIDPDGPRCGCGARGCLETLVRPGLDEEAVASSLALALRSVVHLVDPECVVLGGRFSSAGPSLAEDVEARLGELTLGGRWNRCRVLPASFGDDAALVGGATVALGDALADPMLLADTGAPAAVPRRRRSAEEA